MAFWLFAISLAAIFVINVYYLASGASRALMGTGAMVATSVIAVIAIIAILELVYARSMQTRGVFR